MKNNYWKGIPGELYHLAMAQLARGLGSAYQGSMLDYCIEVLEEKVNNWSYDVSYFDLVRMIDCSIECGFYPLEAMEQGWKSNHEKIQRLLDASAQFIKRLAPEDYRDAARSPGNHKNKVTLYEMSQKLSVYYSTLYMYTGDLERLEKYLNRVLEDTKRNMEFTLFCGELDPDLFTKNTDRHFPGINTWDSLELLSWMGGKEFLPCGPVLELFTQVYEKYCLFLEDNWKIWQPDKAYLHLHYKAENLLQELCNQNLDIIDDQLRDAPDDAALLDRKETMERILRESQERSTESDRNIDIDIEVQDYTPSFEDTKAAETMPASEYRTKWAPFSDKLRKIIEAEENKDLPVVILASYDGSNPNCGIGYVYDKKTKMYKEKIIAIYSRKTGYKSIPEQLE